MKIPESKIAVTGGTGFVGRHVTEELGRAGAAVYSMSHSTCDLRDPDQIRHMLMTLQPDAVVHLAATVGGIGANRKEPGRFFYENAIMGIQLLEMCRQYGVKKVLVAGTVCAYPKFCPTPFKEDDLWEGYPEETNAPYGLAKRMLLVQAQAYRQQYDMNIIYVLPVNLYGPHDTFDLESGHVIPNLIQKFVEAKEKSLSSVTLWGDGTPTREFLHVRDVARGFRLALASYDKPDPVNLGSSEEISIAELAMLIRSLVGYMGEIKWDTNKPNGQPRRRLDVSRATREFGFTSQISFEMGLKETIDWYLENRPG